MVFGKRKTTYHRLVCMACVPCLVDAEGYTVEPYMVRYGMLRGYEANHMSGDVRDCRRINLEPLPKAVHRALKRR